MSSGPGIIDVLGLWKEDVLKANRND